MEFDIIKTDYFKSLNGFSPFFGVVTVVAFIFIILDYTSIDLFENNQIIGIISTSTIVLFLILGILNAILFLRVGVIKFDDEKIVIDKEGRHSEFLLSNIQKVEVRKVQRKQFLIQVQPVFEEIVELNENDLIQLKDYFNSHQINYQHKSIGNWIKRIFKIKS